MGEETLIEWATYTFNPWIGCTEVSAGCGNCYARGEDQRRFSKTLPGCSKEAPVGHWGPGAPRYRTSEENWAKPLRWEKIAADAANWSNGEPPLPVARPRVFCASLADWLDPEVDPMWLADLLNLIAETPHLDWLLLTKRPQLFRERMQAVREVDGDNKLAWHWGQPGAEAPANVWAGTTVENRAVAEERLEALEWIPAAIHFVSAEPLLEAIDFYEICYGGALKFGEQHKLDVLWFDWLICGGESGDKARGFDIAWARSIRNQCRAGGVQFFMKQLGAAPYASVPHGEGGVMCSPITLKHPKGGDPDEWPADLRIREIPEGRR